MNRGIVASDAPGRRVGLRLGRRSLGAGLRRTTAAIRPDGVDVYFKNGGGAAWGAVLPLLNPFARIPVCSLIAQYNSVGLFEGPTAFPSSGGV